MRAGYVCTNYNNSEFTLAAVESLIADKRHSYEIVVVDNDSRDGSADRLLTLAHLHPNVEVLLLSENIGYFSGLNAGIRNLRARWPEIDVIVVGNNDLVFPVGFGDALERNIDKIRNYPVISPDITTLDGVHQNPHVIRRIGKLREVIYDIYYANYFAALGIRFLASITSRFTDREDESEHEVAQPIYQGHGACYILGPKFFQYFRELWAPTFMMGEEYFLSKQLSDRGMTKFYEPSINVLHHCHGALGKMPGRKSWEMARDAHRVYRKYVRVRD